MSLSWTIANTKFSAPIAASKLDKLAKRGFLGGLDYDLAEIPENVRLALLAKAVEEFLRSPLKNADKENITREAAVELMTNRLDLLKSGNIKAAAATGKRAPSLRTAARKRIRQMIKDQLDEDVAKEDLDNAVKQVFEAYDTWNKKTTSAEDKAQLEPVANIVVQAMKDAEDDLKRQAKLAAGLSQLASMAKKSPSTPKPKPAPTAAATTGKKKKVPAAPSA